MWAKSKETSSTLEPRWCLRMIAMIVCWWHVEVRVLTWNVLFVWLMIQVIAAPLTNITKDSLSNTSAAWVNQLWVLEWIPLISLLLTCLNNRVKRCSSRRCSQSVVLDGISFLELFNQMLWWLWRLIRLRLWMMSHAAIDLLLMMFVMVHRLIVRC